MFAMIYKQPANNLTLEHDTVTVSEAGQQNKTCRWKGRVGDWEQRTKAGNTCPHFMHAKANYG